MTSASSPARSSCRRVGDWVALVALALQAKELSGDGMGGGIAIAAIFICLWAPVVLLAGLRRAARRPDRDPLAPPRRLRRARPSSPSGSRFCTRRRCCTSWRRCSASGSPSRRRPSSPSSPSSQARARSRSANGTVETARALGFTLGPLCGGLLVAAGGITAAMLVDAASFVVVGLAALSLSRAPCRQPRGRGRAAPRTRRDRLPPRRPRRRADGRRRLRLAPLHVRVDPRRPRLRRGRPRRREHRDRHRPHAPGPSGC